MQNNPFLPNLTLYFIILLFAYLSTYFIGRLAVAFVPEIRNSRNPIESIFNRLVIGFVVLVSLFAIIWTKGNSIFLTFVLIGGIYFFIRDKENSPKPAFIKLTKSELLSVLGVWGLFILFFFLSYFLFFIRSGGEPWCDHVWYANLSNVLTISHIESGSLFVDNNATGMYHFGEIWFNSFWSTLFHVNHLHVLLLITYSYFFSLCILGGISVVQLFFKGYFLPIILGISVPFLKPVVAFFIPFVVPIATNPKLIVVAVLLLFAMIQYLRKNFNLAFTSLLLLVPFYSPMAPGILSGLFLLVLWWEFSKNGFQFKTIVNRYTIACILVFLFFVLFYIVQTLIPHAQESSQSMLLYEHPVKKTLMFIIKRTSRVMILLIPISMLLGFLNFKTKERNLTSYWGLIVFTVFGVFFSSIVGGIMANFKLSDGQICTNFTDTVVNIVVFTCLIYVISLMDFKKAFFIGIFALILYVFLFSFRGLPVFYPVSTTNPDEKEYTFYNKLKIEMQQTYNPEFAYYRNYEIQDNKNSMCTLLESILPLSKMSHILPSGYYVPYCLSVFDIPADTKPPFDERQQSHFWKYVQQKRKIQPSVSINDCAMGFIKEKHIEYIVVEKFSKTPDYLSLNAVLLSQYDGNKIFKMNYAK